VLRSFGKTKDGKKKKEGKGGGAGEREKRKEATQAASGEKKRPNRKKRDIQDSNLLNKSDTTGERGGGAKKQGLGEKRGEFSWGGGKRGGGEELKKKRGKNALIWQAAGARPGPEEKEGGKGQRTYGGTERKRSTRGKSCQKVRDMKKEKRKKKEGAQEKGVGG